MSEEFKGTSYSNSREDEAVNKTLKGELDKLSKMEPSKRVEYIFNYYKFHILVIVIVIASIVGFIHHRLTYETTALFGYVINSTQVNEEAENVITEYAAMGKHDRCVIQTGLYSDFEGQGGYMNQLVVYVAAGSMDFVLTDEAGLKYIGNMGAVNDVRDLLPKELAEKWADRVVEMEIRDASSEDENATIVLPLAVDISGTEVAKFFGTDANTKYLMPVDLSNHEDYMNAFYQLLIDIENGEYNF